MEIVGLNNSLTKLGKQGLELQVKRLALEIDTSKEKLVEAIEDTYKGDAEKTMKVVVDSYIKAMKGATTKDEAKKLITELSLIVSGTPETLRKALDNPIIRQSLHTMGVNWASAYKGLLM